MKLQFEERTKQMGMPKSIPVGFKSHNFERYFT